MGDEVSSPRKRLQASCALLLDATQAVPLEPLKPTIPDPAGSG